MANRTINNKFNVEWTYAKTCWLSLVDGTEVPPVPKYKTWEINDATGVKKLAKETLIDPMKVSCRGTTLFG